MTPDQLAEMWASYKSRAVDHTFHPDDHMMAHHARDFGSGVEPYLRVGESGARVVFSALANAKTEKVGRVLDFGCGHGRVARHLRAMFPDAELNFADVDPTCVEFCSGQFNGRGVVTGPDFGLLELPRGMDVIFVGSVFTHIDHERMKVLFDRLFESLASGGALIATFRGPRAAVVTKGNPLQAKAYAPLLEMYAERGVAYQSYNRPELGDWGISQLTVEAIVGLGTRHGEARLIGYSECGWANSQDVAVWSKWT
jgi:SAM-dependent methyltransferase